MLLLQPSSPWLDLRVASATYNSVNTRACAAEIQYQVTNDEDGMPVRGARLHSHCHDASGGVTRPRQSPTGVNRLIIFTARRFVKSAIILIRLSLAIDHPIGTT